MLLNLFSLPPMHKQKDIVLNTVNLKMVFPVNITQILQYPV